MKLGLGCLTLLVVWAAVTVFVDRLTSAGLPPDLRFFVALPAGLLITLGLSNVWSLARGYGRGDASRAALLARARTGEPPAQDGPIAVTGVVRAEGGTFHAPISGTECVAYEYRLYTRQRRAGKYQETPIYWGYAMRPFRIDSPRHAFRIMAMPRLPHQPTRPDSPDARERAKAYVAATRFEPKRAFPGIASTAVTMFNEIVSEPSGEVRHDWQAADLEFGIDALLMEETVVPVGATVSASGRWSAERRAIVPGEIGEGQLGVTVVPGEAEELGRSGASELPYSVLSVAVTAVVFLGLGAALVWLSTTGQIAEWWRAWR